jgi:hypothetical protein
MGNQICIDIVKSVADQDSAVKFFKKPKTILATCNYGYSHGQERAEPLRTGLKAVDDADIHDDRLDRNHRDALLNDTGLCGNGP